MLILIGILPGIYALNVDAPEKSFQSLLATSQASAKILDQAAGGQMMSNEDAGTHLSGFLKTTGNFDDQTLAAAAAKNHDILKRLDGKKSFADVPKEDKPALRSDIYLVSESINKMAKLGHLTDPQAKETLLKFRSQLKGATDFIPAWVKVAVAMALGFWNDDWMETDRCDCGRENR